MALDKLSIKEKGSILSLFAGQCYQDPEFLFEPKDGFDDISSLPLDNITRSVGGDEIDYTNYGTIKTDMLLINAGIRINLFKRYTHKKSYTPSTNTTPTNTRYKDTSPTKTSDPAIPNKNTPKETTPKKKIPIKIKPNGPTKDKDDRS